MTRPNLRSMPNWERLVRFDAGRETWIHPDLPQSRFVYRYMDIAGAVATFNTRSFRMKPPRRWDDPYERWWCDQLFRSGSHLVDAKAYGLCWTTRNRDEPFWRLYTCPDRPTVPAIRVRTTVGKLVERMNRLIETEVGKAYLGRVRYTSAAALHDTAARLVASKEVARSAAIGLHWKRSQFMIEREVRLLWVVTAPSELPYYGLPFDSATFIDQIMVGPTVDKNEARRAIVSLVAAGAPISAICRSRIYDAK